MTNQPAYQSQDGLCLPETLILDNMSQKELDAKLAAALRSAQKGRGRLAEDVFTALEKKYGL